jgi:hypothetical protein
MSPSSIFLIFKQTNKQTNKQTKAIATANRRAEERSQTALVQRAAIKATKEVKEVKD